MKPGILDRARVGGQPKMLERRFGSLLVLNPARERSKEAGTRHWVCQCDCGTRSVVSQLDLLLGLAVSCGCVRVAPRAKGRWCRTCRRRGPHFCRDGTPFDGGRASKAVER